MGAGWVGVGVGVGDRVGVGVGVGVRETDGDAVADWDEYTDGDADWNVPGNDDALDDALDEGDAPREADTPEGVCPAEVDPVDEEICAAGD